MANILEEKLREAACIGDLYAARSLISRNININSQNIVNGWTALHWAVKRGHEDIVKLLLQYGADPNIENNKGQKAPFLSTKSNISKLFGEANITDSSGETELNFVPNYMENPPLFVDLLEIEPKNVNQRIAARKETYKNEDTRNLIVRVRIASSGDDDFIEFEMPFENATYNSLLKKCCEELEIRKETVVKIKKGLVRIRNDADVRRFRNVEYLDIFVKDKQ